MATEKSALRTAGKKMESEGFVYCWTDHLTNRLYVGSHKGTINDGYICSSKLMLEEYYKRPNDFTRQIIAEGKYTDMRVFEYKLLEMVDAKHDKQFYNQHNGNGKFYCKGHTKKSIEKINRGCKLPNGQDKRARFGPQNGMFGKKHPEETKEKIRKKSGHWKGKKHSKSTKQKMKKPKPEYFVSPKGKYWWNNGQIETQSKHCPGELWERGRLSKNKEKK